MTAVLRRFVRERALDRCEYCHLPQSGSFLSFHLEHIIPRQHGGSTTAENLALACPHCNLRKGPNLTGIDPDNGEVCRLFHPRVDVWTEHFDIKGAGLHGHTSIGRVTIRVLDLNAEDQLRLRSMS